MNWRIDSETGVLQDVLLCRPEHYEWLPISDTTRATIAAGIEFDRDRAIAQHRELVAVLEEAGATCHFLEPQAGLPDLCWTRDSSQVTPWGPMVTRLGAPERQRETEVLRDYYRGCTVSVWREPPGGVIEGGDVHIIRPGLLAVGHSRSRTSHAAAAEFGGWFEKEGWDVLLLPVDDRFVHLDVLFCMAATGLAIACDEAVGGELSGWLRRHRIRALPVTLEETGRLGCNCLALGNDRVILASKGLQLAKALRAEGLEVVELDLDMFTRAGGGVHCLTQPLRRAPI